MNSDKLKALVDEKRSLVVDKKSIEQQLLAERSGGDRGHDWEMRAKGAVTRIDKRLAAINAEIVAIDPSGRQRGQLKMQAGALVIPGVGESAQRTADALNELLSRGAWVKSFAIVQGDLVCLVEAASE